MQNRLKTILNQAQIPGAAIAITTSSGSITTQVAGVTNNLIPQDITDTTVFEAASLSKPLFAYLVIKMAERNEIDLDKPLHEYVPESGFGPQAMRNHPNYKLLTARILLSHQAGLPNEFTSEESEKYLSKVGEAFDYSAEGYQFLKQVVEKKTSRSLEQLAQETFKKIGMTNSSFMPPSGCCLIKLPDKDKVPTPESVQKLLENVSDRHGQLSIILHKNTLFVAERAVDGTVQITNKDINKIESSRLEEIKARFAEIPPNYISKPIIVEARELDLVTDIAGHSPQHAATIAIGHYPDATVNGTQKFFNIQPAGSLYTSAADYGKFLRECATDPFVQKEMFGMTTTEDGEVVYNPVVPSLVADTKGNDLKVPKNVLNKLAWGVGMGIQRNQDGSLTAFHWGDIKTGRNFAAINLKTKQSVACFTNSANGPLVFQKIAEPVVGSIKPICQWLSQREGLKFNSTSVYKDALANTRTYEPKEHSINIPNPFKTTPS